MALEIKLNQKAESVSRDDSAVSQQAIKLLQLRSYGISRSSRKGAPRESGSLEDAREVSEGVESPTASSQDLGEIDRFLNNGSQDNAANTEQSTSASNDTQDYDPFRRGEQYSEFDSGGDYGQRRMPLVDSMMTKSALRSKPHSADPKA